MNKIILGTAQFGLNYGVNNKRGKIPQPEVFEILNNAFDLGIDTLDTGYSYGDSEQLLGSFMKFYQKRFKIISKLPKCEYKQVEQILALSLNKLDIPKIYGYLIHDFQNYKKNQKIWLELEKLKSNGKIEKIGFSLYFPNELKFIVQNHLKVDIIQVPFSILDQRFLPYFSMLKDKGVEIYVRSVFLQGLVFKKVNELDNYFDKIKDKIKRLNLLSEELRISTVALCVNFALANMFVNKVVVGVDNWKNLDEIIKVTKSLPKVKRVIKQLYKLSENDEKIILPFKWPLKTIEK